MHHIWEQVREEKQVNKEVRWHFYKISDVDEFLMRHATMFVGEAYRVNEQALQKKLLEAWIHAPCKIGRPQLTCNNNFCNALFAFLLELQGDNQDLFIKWTPIAAEEDM